MLQKGNAVPKATLRKEKWTLSFDPRLKTLVVKAARRKGMYPVALLEEIVRERFNPYGHTAVKDSAEYVAALRKESRKQTDEEFLAEIRAWQKSRSS
jgi:hypothetical protein